MTRWQGGLSLPHDPPRHRHRRPAAAACAARDDASIPSSRTCRTGQAERIFPAIAELLARNGATYADLTRVAVTTGPGSFTGVRIGLSAARGLGLALGIPVIGVPSLLAISLPPAGPGHRAARCAARRGLLPAFAAPGVPMDGRGRSRRPSPAHGFPISRWALPASPAPPIPRPSRPSHLRPRRRCQAAGDRGRGMSTASSGWRRAACISSRPIPGRRDVRQAPRAGLLSRLAA